MKLVMTLLARDEADIVESRLAFHLNGGADFIVATDNRSGDGATEILECYVREGFVHLIHEPGEHLRQDEWVTRMAWLAATDVDAGGVIHSDDGIDDLLCRAAVVGAHDALDDAPSLGSEFAGIRKRALEQAAERADARRCVVAEVVGDGDGRAAERAVIAIVEGVRGARP